MKRSIAQAVTGVALFGAFAAATLQSTPSQADTTTHHTWHHTVNARQRHQQGRIYNGVNHGSLTRREARHLETRESNIARAERHDRRSGGTFTAQERRNIERRENRTSHAIYHQKHDAQHR